MINQDQAYNDSLAGRFGFVWGVTGVCMILLFAVVPGLLSSCLRLVRCLLITTNMSPGDV